MTSPIEAATHRFRRPILDAWPALASALHFEPLGEFPTPVGRVRLGACDLWVKRDDLSSPVYGGNKVRTLELLFADARALRATHVYSTGAFGSNHAAATVLHAPRAGLASGVVLFPQPPSEAAAQNLRAILAARPVVHDLAHWSTLPVGMWRARRASERGGHVPYIMVPGGATPLGALGYVSAALELAEQVASGALPCPDQIVIGVGSTCTSAGLLVGLAHAARRGLLPRVPTLVSVRVTPWPVTSALRIVGLAARSSRLLADLSDEPTLALNRRTLGAKLVVDGTKLGRGYGHPTAAGLSAIEAFRASAGIALDTTYSAKSAARAVELARASPGEVVLFWSTKSTVPLPSDDPDLSWAPRRMRAWLEQCDAAASRSAG